MRMDYRDDRSNSQFNDDGSEGLAPRAFSNYTFYHSPQDPARCNDFDQRSAPGTEAFQANGSAQL